MLDEKELNGMVEEYNKADALREDLIKKSREVIKLSKKVIYSTHRNEIEKADENLKEMNSALAEFKEIAEKNPELLYSGIFKNTVQEFVEAACYLEYIKNKKIPTRKELDVSMDGYLLGLCDLTGELIRNAVNSATKGDYEEVETVKDLVVEIYENLMQFDFRNSDLRRKFDGIKYDVKKIEDIVFQIKMKK